MRTSARWVLSLAALIAATGTRDASAQAPTGKRTPSAFLTLVGLNGKPRSVTAADFARLPHVEATVSSHNVQGSYKGVPLGDLLLLVDRPAGAAIRGSALAITVSVEAADGYRAVFALAEVDSGFTNKVVFLADAKNGEAIDATEGPLRLVVPDEKRPARWVKQVTRIRLITIK